MTKWRIDLACFNSDIFKWLYMHIFHEILPLAFQGDSVCSNLTFCFCILCLYQTLPSLFEPVYLVSVLSKAHADCSH